MKLTQLIENQHTSDFDLIKLVFQNLFGKYETSFKMIGKKDIRLLATSKKRTFKIIIDMAKIDETKYLMEVFFDVKKLLQDGKNVVLEDSPTLSLYSPPEQKIEIGQFEAELKKHFIKIEKEHKNYKRLISNYMMDLK
jgi:hypothetical protein